MKRTKRIKIKIPTIQLEELEIADKHDVLSLEHNVHMSEMQEFSPSVTSPLARIHSKDCNEGLVHIDTPELSSLRQTRDRINLRLPLYH